MGRPKGSTNGKSKRGGKSKAEASTGKNEATAEMRKAELDLQPIEIDDGDFDMHLRAMKGAVDKQKIAKNLYDGCCKAAKKVSPDLLDALKRAIKFEGMDREDIKRQLEIDGYVLKKTGSSVQLTIHDVILGDVNANAFEQGYANGMAGTAISNRFPEGSDLARLYEEGYVKAQTELASRYDANNGLPPADHNEMNGMHEGV